MPQLQNMKYIRTHSEYCFKFSSEKTRIGHMQTEFKQLLSKFGKVSEF